MKTQLLEDIGQSAPLSPVPPAKVGHPTASKAEQTVPLAGVAPIISEKQHTDPSLDPPDLDKVFEEIAALEAQYQRPAQRYEPAAEPTVPLDQPIPAPAEPILAAQPALEPTARHDPVFDLTLPLPEQNEPNPFTPPGAARTRARRPYLMWAAGALSAALLAQGGWWLYKERKDDGSLAFVATQARETPRVDRAVQAQASVPAETPAPAPPPLVMLEPDLPAPAAAEQREPATAEETGAPAPAVEQDTPAPPPRPAGRVTRRQADSATGTAAARAKRESARQVARAPVMQADVSSAAEGSMSALLRACREHGYHATQCIKQGCSVTRYGFACRGR